MDHCTWHRCRKPLTGKQTKFCNKSCSAKFYADLNRRGMKLRAVEYLGGKCQRCNYEKCVAALEFHHRDPTTKCFGIGDGNNRTWEEVKVELDKCDLLCSNCHKEVEAAAMESLRDVQGERLGC